MRFDSPLDDILLNRSHVRVLRALHCLPEGLAASGREIARRAGVTHPTAIKALGVLAGSGLVTVSRGWAGDAYKLNRDHALANRVADLFQTEGEMRHILQSFLRDGVLALTDKVEWATLFGSAVWGEPTSSSDIDLAVSCAAADADEVERALADLSEMVRQRFGNHVNALLNTRKHRPRSGVWTRLEDDGVALIRSGRAVSA